MEVPLKSAELLDIPSNSCWQRMEEMNEARYGSAAATLQNYLVVLGGMGSKREPLSSVEMYNPITKEWISSTSMRVGRYAHAAVAIAENLYVCGGVIRGKPGEQALITTNRVERYTSNLDVWEVMPKMAEARSFAAGAMLSALRLDAAQDKLEAFQTAGGARRARQKEGRPGHVYICGGEDGSGNSLATAERFDIPAEKWSSIASMRLARAGCAAATAAGALYVMGGADHEKTPLESVERFDPAIGAWGLISNMTCSRRNCSAVAAAGVLYVFGGEGNAGWAGLSTAERFDPEVGMWEPIRCSMSTVRSGCCSALL